MGGVSPANMRLPVFFTRAVVPPLAAAYLSKTEFYGDRPVKFDIWDTSGQGACPSLCVSRHWWFLSPSYLAERFRSLTPMYYRDAEVALLVFDVGSRVSTLRSVTLSRQLLSIGTECKHFGGKLCATIVI